MRRVGFAVLLAITSAFFAESSLGSASVTQNPIWGVFVLLPLYGLHALVLGRIAFSRGRPAFATLYLCGVLFGLYEAYITKILWTGWDNHPVPVLGVSAIAFPLVALWYHPFVSFMIPLAFLERYALGWKADEHLTPNWVQSRLDNPRTRVLTLIGFGGLMGLYHSGVANHNPTITFFSAVDALWLLLAVLIWKRRAGTLQDLLPSGKGLWVTGCLLALLYLLGGFVLARDKLPGIGPQATILAIYAVVIVSLIRSFRLSSAHSVLPPQPPAPLIRDWPWLVGGWFTAALVPRFVPGMTIVTFVVCSLAGLAVAGWAIAKTVRELRSIGSLGVDGIPKPV